MLREKLRAGTATDAEIDALLATPHVLAYRDGTVRIQMPNLPPEVADQALTRYARRIEAEQREQWTKGTV